MELNVVHEWDEEDEITHGTLWKNTRTERYYVLAQVGRIGWYALINLDNGNRFRDPVSDIEEAFENDLGENNFVRFTGTIELSQNV